MHIDHEVMKKGFSHTRRSQEDNIFSVVHEPQCHEIVHHGSVNGGSEEAMKSIYKGGQFQTGDFAQILTGVYTAGLMQRQNINRYGDPCHWMIEGIRRNGRA